MGYKLFFFVRYVISNLTIGYTTAKPAHFKLQDDGSAIATQALAAVYGEFCIAKMFLLRK